MPEKGHAPLPNGANHATMGVKGVVSSEYESVFFLSLTTNH